MIILERLRGFHSVELKYTVPDTFQPELHLQVNILSAVRDELKKTASHLFGYN
jgi:hypothetical protein